MPFKKNYLLLPIMIICLSACTHTSNQTSSNSPYTHGNVQLNLEKGVTTQSDVLNAFGAPNLTTINGEGEEVWTYQKHATLSKSNSNSSYATIILLGRAKNSSGFEQASRTMTLIIKFNADKIISDFESMSSSF